MPNGCQFVKGQRYPWLPYKWEVFSSTNSRQFGQLRLLILKVAGFNLCWYTLSWRETQVAKIKIVNLPDKLESVTVFTGQNFYVGYPVTHSNKSLTSNLLGNITGLSFISKITK